MIGHNSSATVVLWSDAVVLERLANFQANDPVPAETFREEIVQSTIMTISETNRWRLLSPPEIWNVSQSDNQSLTVANSGS